MNKILSKRELQLIKLRSEKHGLNNKGSLAEVLSVIDCALQLLKQNSLLKEKLFDIEQSTSEEDRILNIIDAKLNLALLSNDKKSFLEINKSANNDVWTIIIQKKFGQTPLQLLKSSEVRRFKAAKKILNLLKENKSLTVTLADARRDLSILNGLKLGSIDEIITCKEDLKRAYDLITGKIKIFNGRVFYNKARMAEEKLHDSFYDALRDAWARAANANAKVNSLSQQLFKLQSLSKQKKSLMALIYGRKKKGKTISKHTFRRSLVLKSAPC